MKYWHFTYWQNDYAILKFDFPAQLTFLPDVTSFFVGWSRYTKSARRRRVFSPAPGRSRRENSSRSRNQSNCRVCWISPAHELKKLKNLSAEHWLKIVLYNSAQKSGVVCLWRPPVPTSHIPSFNVFASHVPASPSPGVPRPTSPRFPVLTSPSHVLITAEISRRLRKSSTSSRICITVSNSRFARCRH